MGVLKHLPTKFQQTKLVESPHQSSFVMAKDNIGHKIMKEELVFIPLVPPILLFNNATGVHQDT
jgi:hypothetical protein